MGAREYRTLTRPVDGAVVQAGVDLAPIEEERQRVLVALALAAAIAGAVAAWLGTLLARRALTVWDEALARQRQFIADASHELRTPLARLALRSELLDRDLRAAGVPESVLSDVTLLRQDSATLAEVLEDLLHAAEVSDRPDAGELVDLSEVVGEPWPSARCSPKTGVCASGEHRAGRCGARLPASPAACGGRVGGQRDAVRADPGAGAGGTGRAG